MANPCNPVTYWQRLTLTDFETWLPNMPSRGRLGGDMDLHELPSSLVHDTSTLRMPILNEQPIAILALY
jgi:hypothetical protein